MGVKVMKEACDAEQHWKKNTGDKRKIYVNCRLWIYGDNGLMLIFEKELLKYPLIL